MPLRVYLCPVIGTGTKQDPFRSKGQVSGVRASSFFPSKADGTPASAWVLSALITEDFTALDADTTCVDLFGGDLPATVKTRDDLLKLLRSRTVGDVPTARRNKITAVLDQFGVARADFTAATPLWKVMQRVISTLLEKDDGFGSAF